MSDTPRTDAAKHNMGSVVEPHYVVDIEIAQDLEREITRLKGEAESWEQVFDRTCQLLADEKTKLAEAVTKERERCAKVCERVSIPYENTSSAAAAAIRKGE